MSIITCTQNQLKSATRKIQLMKNGVVSNRESPFDKLSDDIVFRVMAYMPSANLVSVSQVMLPCGV